jgi:hypothetical protein
MIDQRPQLIARCTNAADVAQIVGFARDRELPLAVRGGGHNGAGLGSCDDGVVIDLSPLGDVEVDPHARTVRVGGGCTCGEVDRRTVKCGLATPSGIISTTECYRLAQKSRGVTSAPELHSSGAVAVSPPRCSGGCGRGPTGGRPAQRSSVDGGRRLTISSKTSATCHSAENLRRANAVRARGSQERPWCLG